MNSRHCARDSTREWSLESQRRFWNDWDTQYLQPDTLGSQALRRGQVVMALVRALGLKEPRILEIGCGNGWLAEQLQEIGPVVGVDISDVAIEAARHRVPAARFESGDILKTNLPPAAFDIIVSLETLSHVADQQRFMEVAAATLRNRGHLILATQNRTVYMRRRDVDPPAPGQLRHWVTRRQLRCLLAPCFRRLRLFTIEPAGDLGFLWIVNSRKLNSVLSKLVRHETIQAVKEKLGFGQTIVALAEKRDRQSIT